MSAEPPHSAQAATLVAPYILAGGQSSRFGSDKARALVEGRPMICRLAESAARCAVEVMVVAQQSGQYGDLGLRTIADLQPGLGPIGGLETALADAAARDVPWALVLSTDLVGFEPDWLRLLRDGGGAKKHAVAFRGEHVEPLCALYRPEALPQVRHFIAGGGRALYRLLELLDTAYLPLPADWPALAHVNTPEELERALQT
jgi:molybdopterin-guanine dinucleotide biosynthesis protein A